MIKKVIFSTLLMVFFYGINPSVALAQTDLLGDSQDKGGVPTDAKTELTEQVFQYVKKFGKTAFYLETTLETIAYIETIGDLDANAVMDYLKVGMSELGEFQEALKFADSRAFSSLLKGDLTSAINDTVNDVKETTKGMAQDVLDDALAEYEDFEGEEDELEEEDDYIDESEHSFLPDSSAQKVVVVKRNFGQPQENKAAAEKFIRSRYYYSTKEGDVYDGKPLTETDLARKLVVKNRFGYNNEVLATSIATAYESLTKGKEDSMKRLQDLQDKANKAESIDEKRAVEALIVQEEIRQRMLRLNIELASLEKDLVEEMQSTEAAYIIARTVEQIEQDTQELLDDLEEEDDDVLTLGGKKDDI